MKLLAICFVTFTCVSAFPTETLGPSHEGRKLKVVTNSTPFRTSSVSVESTTYNPQVSTVVKSTTQEVDGPGVNDGPECRELTQLDGTTRRVCPSSVPNGATACNIRMSQSATGAGLLYQPFTTESRTACCEVCRGVPDSKCKSWWRDRGSNMPCYVNSNP